MKILVTNDDGIDAPGLWALAAELTKVGEVIVCAPHQEQSGVGTAITLRRLVCFAEVKSAIPEAIAYAVEGTPADSVLLALEIMKDISVVFSGINRGLNLGSDVLLSGTVGAALQGYLRGLPSIALSVVRAEETNFQAASRLAGLLASRIAAGPSEKMLLNINLPNLQLDMIRGIEVTRVGSGGYGGAIKIERDEGRYSYRIKIGQVKWDAEEGTDINAVENGSISITPLLGTLSAAERVPLLDGSVSLLFRQLIS
ncbi:MAG: 5'/3'-nucleotidase SurE [Chloroflexi bacterium]|nr:5'/3'-nucleotidase SurE [Chloroflexota bacterium]